VLFRSPSELSGGQQQRVAVARALVLEPQVLLFDEPLSNLDAKLRRRVRDDIRELQQKLNLTVAYVTHDQEEALAVSDRIIVMSNARIAQSGTPRELYEEPASLFVADFIGDANLVDAELLEERGERALARLDHLDLDLPRRGASRGPIKLAIRPDAILVHRARPAREAIGARIAKASYLGKHVEYTVASPVGDLFVIDRAEKQPVGPGTEVWLSFEDRDVTIVPT
jgi:iron(III) transport system ATP-binding protein